MNFNAQENFLKYIQSNQLFQKGDNILLAVSGGADSMVLCNLYLQAEYSFGLAHCNFQLRGSDSDRDEAFVADYATKHDLPFHHIRFSTSQYAKENRLSIEEAARNLRYQWFEEIRKQYGYQYIATAHHQNDNAETLLLNLFRGTGIHGLHGILPKRDKIIRPILFLSKADISNYANEQQIAFVKDITNDSSAYTRNFIRNKIMPIIEKKFPDVIPQMNNNIHRFSEAEQLYNQAIAHHSSQLIEIRGNEVFIPILKLIKCHPLDTIAYEIFKNYGFSYEQSRQIIQLADKTSGKVVQSATHQLLRDRKWFIISPLQEKDNKYIVIDKETKEIQANNLHLHLSTISASQYRLSSDTNIAALDADKIAFPLLLRKWKQGDYFYPLGMRKKKKLSRFFIDQKLSLNEKEKVWVLVSEQRILWVVGMRIDDRFKITTNTKRILTIKVA